MYAKHKPPLLMQGTHWYSVLTRKVRVANIGVAKETRFWKYVGIFWCCLTQYWHRTSLNSAGGNHGHSTFQDPQTQWDLVHGLGLVHILHCHCLCVGFLNFEIYTVIYKYIIFPCWECLLALSQLGINWYTNNKVVSIVGRLSTKIYAVKVYYCWYW